MQLQRIDLNTRLALLAALAAITAISCKQQQGSAQLPPPITKVAEFTTN
jgi:hypothetical protein